MGNREPLFRCAKCGGSKLRIPEIPESVPDDYVMQCDNCGEAIAEWKSLRRKAYRMAVWRAVKTIAARPSLLSAFRPRKPD
jgi:hypothetical protein